MLWNQKDVFSGKLVATLSARVWMCNKMEEDGNRVDREKSQTGVKCAFFDHVSDAILRNEISEDGC